MRRGGSPGFLKHPQEQWPLDPERNDMDEQRTHEELPKPKPEVTRSLATVNTRSNLDLDKVIDCSRFNTKSRLLRVTAYVRRFIEKSRRARLSSVELTAREVKEAERLWLRSIQYAHFAEESNYLVESKSKPPRLVDQLGLFMDDEGLIRCQTRI